eukprot:3269757-Karenia_brevis.AAC.1
MPHGRDNEGTSGMHCYSWECSGGRFVFVVDCLPVQRVVCGHASLEDPDGTRVFERTALNLAAIFAD